MDLLTANYVELSDLRQSHGALMSAVLYISPSHPGGMISLEPETIALSAGLGIGREVKPVK